MPIGNTQISASIITLNEAKKLRDCILSLDWVDEIVVVDSLSGDATVEIAESLGAKVIEQPFLGHVKQKDFAVRHCSNNWVICLDADERVSPQLKTQIIKLFETHPDGDLPCKGYTVARRSFHLGRWILHGGWYPDRNIRLFDRRFGGWHGVDPHDRIEVAGKLGNLNAALDHYVFDDLAHNVQQNNFFSGISAKILYEKGKKPSLIKLIFKPPGKFIETYFVKQGFRDGLPGFIIAVGAAYSMFLKYAKLWEYYLKDKVEPPSSAL